MSNTDSDEVTSCVKIQVDNTANAPTSTPTRSENDNKSLAKRETLTFAFIQDSDEPGHTYYAVVPFPETYQAALVAAVAILGSRMTDPRPDNIVLKCSVKNREGVWAWANIEPMHWKLVLGRHGDEVGVFEKRRKEGFVEGKVYVTIGIFDGFRTRWKDVDKKHDWHIMDRPKDFNEAVRMVKSWATKTRSTEHAQRLTSPDTKCTFYNLTDQLHSWVAFPPAAYTDDEIWRLVVPPIGHTLGVLLS